MDEATLDRMLRDPKPFQVVQFPTEEDRYRANSLVVFDGWSSFQDDLRQFINTPSTGLVMLKHESGPFGVQTHRHQGSVFELMYVYAGQITHRFASETVTLQQGECILLEPGSEHSIDACGPEDIALNFLMRQAMFRPEFLSTLSRNPMFIQILSQRQRGVELRQNYHVFCCADDAMTQQILHTLIGEFLDSDGLSVHVIQSYLSILFNQLYRVWKQTGGLVHPRKDMGNADVVELLQYIEHHYKTASLRDVAARFGYDSYYMSRLIRKRTGYTFIELKRNICMRRAQELLRDSDLSVREIATEVGVSNSNHFYGMFKKAFSMSPAEYRRLCGWSGETESE